MILNIRDIEWNINVILTCIIETNMVKIDLII